MSIELAGDRLLVADQLDRGFVLEGIPRFTRIARDGGEIVLDWVAFEGTLLQHGTTSSSPVWTDLEGSGITNSWREPLRGQPVVFRLAQP